MGGGTGGGNIGVHGVHGEGAYTIINFRYCAYILYIRMWTFLLYSIENRLMCEQYTLICSNVHVKCLLSSFLTFAEAQTDCSILWMVL